MKIVDARGKACPQPVILTKRALLESPEVRVIVDNEAALHNVTRFAQKQGCAVESVTAADGFSLTVTRQTTEKESDPTDQAQETGVGKTVIAISRNTMGHGDEVLGDVLIRGFLHALNEIDDKPSAVLFFNSGVQLTVRDSPVIDDLKLLSEKGTDILSCGTCLVHFEMQDDLAVGEITNMYTIVEKLMTAEKVVNL